MYNHKNPSKIYRVDLLGLVDRSWDNFQPTLRFTSYCKWTMVIFQGMENPTVGHGYQYQIAQQYTKSLAWCTEIVAFHSKSFFHRVSWLLIQWTWKRNLMPLKSMYTCLRGSKLISQFGQVLEVPKGRNIWHVRKVLSDVILFTQVHASYGMKWNIMDGLINLQWTSSHSRWLTSLHMLRVRP